MKKLLSTMLVGCAALLSSCSNDIRDINGHDAVNLCLPSGTLWATCNVGAEQPSDYGDVFAWGEVETKPKSRETSYSWADYKFLTPPAEGERFGMFTKYCRKSNYGNSDHKVELDPEDDVAHVQWGDKWQMPTRAQFEELVQYCTWDIDTQDDTEGYIVTGKNGQSIFLPFTEMYDILLPGGASPAAEGTNYWLKNLEYVESMASDRGAVMVLGDSPRLGYAHRYKGLSVRPVWTPK